MDHRVKAYAVIICLLFSGVCFAEKEKKNSKVIELEQIVVPVVAGNKVLASYVINLTLEVAEESKSPLVQELLPRIKDSFIEELFVILPLIWNGEGQPDQQLVAARLKMAAEKKTPNGLLVKIFIKQANLYIEDEKTHTMEGNTPALK